MVEYVWAVPATVVLLAALLAVGPRRGLRLRWHILPVSLFAAVAYSWVRWVPEVFDLPRLGEGTDFLIAMLLAAVGGVAIGGVRRWAN